MVSIDREFLEECFYKLYVVNTEYRYIRFLKIKKTIEGDQKYSKNYNLNTILSIKSGLLDGLVDYTSYSYVSKYAYELISCKWQLRNARKLSYYLRKNPSSNKVKISNRIFDFLIRASSIDDSNKLIEYKRNDI